MSGPNYIVFKCGTPRYDKGISFLKFLLFMTNLKK